MTSPRDAIPEEAAADLDAIWAQGYSIGELWGFTKPVSRTEVSAGNVHVLLWGILTIVEQQVDHGAGHKYFRERLYKRDWFAIGYREPKTEVSRLMIVPPIEHAKFGRKFSSVGDGVVNYTDIRVVGRDYLMRSSRAHRHIALVQPAPRRAGPAL